MKRRACLAAMGTGVGVAASGCLDLSDDYESELTVQREPPTGETECVEQEVLDFERVVLAPRLASVIGFPSRKQWDLELRAGEELYLNLSADIPHNAPILRVLDPEGTAVIDERPLENIYTFVADVDGKYTISLSNRRWSEQAIWFIDIIWYNTTGCRPYS